MGVNLKDARVEVEKIIGRGSGFVAVEIPFTPRAKRVLELSLEEARQLGHNYIGTEHILLGLLREGEGVAARVLETLGADPAKIRTQVVRMVGESQEAVGVGGSGPGAGSNKTPTLEEYGTNLTTQAVEAREAGARKRGGGGIGAGAERHELACPPTRRLPATAPQRLSRSPSQSLSGQAGPGGGPG